MIRTTEEWITKFTKKKAYWMHDGNPKRPHVRLHKGGHSDGFFNGELVMEFASLLTEACLDLVTLGIARGVSPDDVDRIVGPAMGGVTLSHEICRVINMERKHFCPDPCRRAYTEKEIDALGKVRMVFRKTSIKPRERILFCDDALSTGDSLDLTARPTEKAGGIILPFVLVLVNRSGLTEISGRKIIALIDRPMNNWAADECELCRAGSEVLSQPEDPSNWKRLNANYSI